MPNLSAISLFEKPSLTKAIVEFEKSDLYRYFRAMRNRITHRLPFVTRGVLSLTKHMFLFPDDPNSDDVVLKTENDIDVLETCKDWVYKILNFVDQTSIIAFRNSRLVTQLKAFDKSTGEEIDIEKHFGKNFETK